MNYKLKIPRRPFEKILGAIRKMKSNIYSRAFLLKSSEQSVGLALKFPCSPVQCPFSFPQVLLSANSVARLAGEGHVDGDLFHTSGTSHLHHDLSGEGRM